MTSRLHISLLISICIGSSILWAADNRLVHIIHTTDIHTQFLPRFEGDGGWLAAATVIHRLQERCGKGASLLIDTGDSTQGTVAASITQGEVGLIPLHALHYDAWIPGNHEFDYGIDKFRQFMEETKDIALCGNLSIKDEPPFRAWRLFRCNGANIAVIGFTSSFMKNWQLPQDAARLEVTPGPELLQRILPEIHAVKPDAIVLATHQGWFAGGDKRGANEVDAIADQFPEIDLILGAHSHRTIPGTKIGHRTWYVQPGAHATHVALATLNIDIEAHKVIEATSILLPVEQDMPQDEELKKLINPFLHDEIAERKRKVSEGLGNGVLSRGTSGINCATSELICMAIAEHVGADVVFHGRMTNKDIPPGPLTADIVYKLIPYDNTIVTMELTLEQIAAIATEQWKWRKHYSYSGIYGARITISKEGKATVIGLGKDQPLPQDANTRRYKVAVHNHAAAGSGRFTVLRELVAAPENHAINHQQTTRAALEHFLEKHPSFSFTPFKWIQTEDNTP
ncbi:MAG: bifunctional metallophosphatase/5'-nucleotidase [Victivallales bacterium]|nr:bifunctional metallophosphatase/5'-nucleotidase [Victivallales bacterium]